MVKFANLWSLPLTINYVAVRVRCCTGKRFELSYLIFYYFMLNIKYRFLHNAWSHKIAMFFRTAQWNGFNFLSLIYHKIIMSLTTNQWKFSSVLIQDRRGERWAGCAYLRIHYYIISWKRWKSVRLSVCLCVVCTKLVAGRWMNVESCEWCQKKL